MDATSPTPLTSDGPRWKRINGAHARAIRPPSRISTSQWAEKHRVLDRKASAVSGQWRNHRVPHLVEPMDCLTDHATRSVVLMFASQTAKTEAGLNWLGRIIDCDPGPALWCTSTEQQLKKLSSRRLDPLLATAVLADRVGRKKGRDADRSTAVIGFENGGLNLVSANSPSGLASDPIKYLVFDEVDRYRLSSQDEGDAIALGLARQTNFEEFGAKTLYISSPDIEGVSRIQQLFEESDQRYFHVPCFSCGLCQPLVWESVRFPNGPESAFYECEGCRAPWTDEQRWEALDSGFWVAREPFKGTAGFHFSQIGSKFVRLRTLAKRWKDSEGKPEQRQGFFNTCLGQTWSLDAARVDSKNIPLERWEYDFPLDACMLLGFTDVQGDRFEVSVFAVGSDETLYAIEHTAIFGKTSQPKVWGELSDYAARTWRRQDGRVMGLTALGIDCGHEFEKVCSWAGKRRARTFAIKGFAKGLRDPIVGDRKVSLNKSGHRFYKSNVDKAKHEVLVKLGLDSGPGRIRFPERQCFGKNYFEQLTCEKLVKRYVRGYPKLEWRKPVGARNEALDCLAGIFGVLRWLNPNLAAIAARVPPLDPELEIGKAGGTGTGGQTEARAVKQPRLRIKKSGGRAWFD